MQAWRPEFSLRNPHQDRRREPVPQGYSLTSEVGTIENVHQDIHIENKNELDIFKEMPE